MDVESEIESQANAQVPESAIPLRPARGWLKKKKKIWLQWTPSQKASTF